MGIVLTDFQGELPGVSNYDLPVNAASEAINCEFGGTVRPARFFSTSPDTSTTGWPVEVYGQWFLSDTPNGILPSPMADDSIDRMYKLSAGQLQRALLSSPTSWTEVGIESPSVTATVEVIQPMTTYVPDGELQAPEGNQIVFQYALMYFGRGDDGKQYYSNRVEGSRVGYANSQLVLTLSDNWSQHLNTVRQQMRYAQVGFSSPFRNSYNGIQLGLFKSDNAGGWLLVADTNAGVPADGRAVIPFNAAANGGWTYSATNVMEVTETFYDESAPLGQTTTTTSLTPPAPKAVEVTQSSVVGAGEASVEDIPDGEIGMSRAYLYTVCRIVADNNGTAVVEEGPPSVAVIVDNIYSNSRVKITFASAVPSGYQFAIYRAHAGMYLYVGDCTAGANVFEDNIPDAALGEECPSFDWLPPPELDGVISTGYGFFVGWKGNRVYCSEVYLPHAWPAAYGYTTKYNIKRCVAVHNGILAITDNGNYFIAGSTPQGLNLVEMPTFHPCIAPNTAVDMGDGVMYVAPTGIALTNSSGSQLVTDGAIDPTWWSSKNWSTAYAYRMADAYVLFVEGESWVFNLRNRTISRGTGLPARATFDQGDGSLKTPTGTVASSAFASSYKWKSKIFEFHNGQSYGWTQCIATAYPVAITWHLWQNDGTKTELVVNYANHHPVRFPPNRWHMVQAEINSGNPVSRISVTSNRQELEYGG
jgi:hypothetical protein